ncbi:MAG: DNA translocase FtsK, partial [Candidatus Coproplasma sp.]
MGEVLNKIITYAKEHTRFLAPALQSELHLGYRELTGALKTLQEKGAIKFIGGMCYEYITEPKKDDSPLKGRSEIEDNSAEKRRAYLEMRRQELIRRMQAETDNDEEDDESDYEDDCDEVMADDKKSDSSMPDPTTLKVLHYCIQRQCASASIIQRRFPIGFIRAVKIIDWMESMGYVASANSSAPRTMLLTEEKFTELYGQANEDEKGVKRTAEFREGVGNLCGV